MFRSSLSVVRSSLRFLSSLHTGLTLGQTDYAYDAFGNLAWAKYEDGQYDYKLPDEVGNLFETKQRNDKEYAEGGRLIRDKDFFYRYDAEGNLIEKTGKETWKYQWQGNGMLKQVEKPDGTKVEFEYDALGRRTAKIVEKNITRFVWDGNTSLHEWTYAVEKRPQWLVDEFGFLEQDQPEFIALDCITWVFDEGTFKPTAKIMGSQKLSIITDYLGAPCQAFNERGEKVWEMELDIYGKIRNIEGASSFIPFRYQGQYEDTETGLYYNRFRYYNPDIGMYLSQDPIGLAETNPNFYAYVADTNSWIDPFGLDVYELTASSDGWYPVYERGIKDPTAYTKLKKGDTYKIGESQRSSRRYSSTRLEEARINRSKATSVAIDINGKTMHGITAGLDMNVIDNGKTKAADQLLENQKLNEYMDSHGGELPAGNKTCH